ncbi:MAG: RHS repeat-associated core domain-containing protein [Armatimonadetes bacterium]|nr:RHS repeat-associated core domain-containing protein [Armatimonadota bacterium]
MMKILSLLKAVGASVLVAVVVLSAGACHATTVTRYADANITSSGDGTSWGTAKKTIAEAIADCNGNGIVKVRGFTSSTPTYNEHINMVEGVSISGGYTGTDDDQDPSYKSVISYTSDCVIYAPSTVTSTTSIVGLDIKSGIGKLQSSYRYGGGIFCDGSPTIQECCIYSNTAKYGGGIYAASGTAPVIHDNEIYSNSCSTGFGNGIYMFGGECTDNYIHGNNWGPTTTTWGLSGGGVYLGSYSSAPVFSENTIDGNGWPSNWTPNAQMASSMGGGVYVAGSTSSLNITNNTVTNNIAGSGGGIYISSAGSVKGNTDISSNRAYYKGGGIYYGGTGDICQNTLSNNYCDSTSGSGGGIYWNASSSATGKVYSNLIKCNGYYGGGTGRGIYVNALQVASLFSNNTIIGSGSGANVYLNNPVDDSFMSSNIVYAGSIGIQRGGTGNYICKKNCVFGNTTDYSPNPSSSTDISNYNLNAGNVFVDTTNYRLKYGSACIDAGEDSSIQSGWLDIDGQDRQNSTVDIGADEFYDITPPTGTIVINGGDETTDSHNVTLTLSSTDTETGVSIMQFINESSSSFSDPETYATTKAWTLSSGYGPKTVAVRYWDVAGNCSVYSDSIKVPLVPTNIAATPRIAGSEDIVTITFSVPAALSPNTEVTVNGHSAVYLNHTGLNYSCQYEVRSDEPSGYATIRIVNTADACDVTDTQALWMVVGNYSGGDVNRITYDKMGNPKTSWDSRGYTFYEYDVTGRLVKVTDPDGRWVAYEYDLNNNRTKMTTHSDSPAFEHVTQYAYYDSGLLHEVTDQLNGVTHYTYKDNGMVDTITYPNSTKAIHSYNSRNWLTTVSNQKSDNTIIAEFTYSYDAASWGKNGTRTSVIENILKPDGNRINALVDYEYDDLYRLVHEHRTANGGGDAGVSYEYNFVYDAAGNRTQWEIVGGSTTNYTYDAANKMTSPGTFTYDDKGNTLTQTVGNVTTTYTWDYLNRMSQWAKTNQTTEDYVYDAGGMRVSKTPSGGTTTYFLLANKAVAEEMTGNNIISYIGPDMSGTIEGMTRTTYHASALGSIRAVTDGNDQIVSATIYDAFGVSIMSYPDSASFSYGFAGKYRYYSDSTGLHYLRTRYYDSSVGRFTSRDSIGYRGGTNLYAYTNNRPTVAIDPKGTKYSCSYSSGGGGAVGVTLGGTGGVGEYICYGNGKKYTGWFAYTCQGAGLYAGVGVDFQDQEVDNIGDIGTGVGTTIGIGMISIDWSYGSLIPSGVGFGPSVGAAMTCCTGSLLGPPKETQISNGEVIAF